jgi:hypothetical protein
MKDLMTRVKSFITFDSPSRLEHINELFSNIHAQNIREFPSWSLAATKKKVIAEYWFRQVLIHFGVILMVSVLFLLPFCQWQFIGQAAFVGGGISFVILTISNYWPTFYSNFLPKLDYIISEKEKQIALAGEMNKAKRKQFLAPTLSIIFYTFCKTSGSPTLAPNDQSAKILNKLYGTDPDKLKENLSRLYKPANLSPKEKAEIQKGIDHARDFFCEIDNKKAGIVLDELQQKLHKV